MVRESDVDMILNNASYRQEMIKGELVKDLQQYTVPP